MNLESVTTSLIIFIGQLNLLSKKKCQQKKAELFIELAE